MIKCEVIENFTLEKYKELNNVNKLDARKDNEFCVGDTFECTKDMAEYLTGKNALNKTVVKVIEVEPEKEIKEKEVIETITTSVGTFGYGPVEVKETKLKSTKKTTKKKK